MSGIEKNRIQIELEINKWKEQGYITNVSRKETPGLNGATFLTRIKSSASSFNVIYTGIACKVAIDGCKEAMEFKWAEEGVAENVISYIKELLEIA